MASVCPRGHGWHVHAENVLLEILDDQDRPCRPGQTGRVLLTTLHNYLTPFLRMSGTRGAPGYFAPEVPSSRRSPAAVPPEEREQPAYCLLRPGLQRSLLSPIGGSSRRRTRRILARPVRVRQPLPLENGLGYRQTGCHPALMRAGSGSRVASGHVSEADRNWQPGEPSAGAPYPRIFPRPRGHTSPALGWSP